MTYTDADYAELDNLVLDNVARFTAEEAKDRRDAFNASVSDDEL